MAKVFCLLGDALSCLPFDTQRLGDPEFRCISEGDGGWYPVTVSSWAYGAP